jgi:hypothetical protein
VKGTLLALAALSALAAGLAAAALSLAAGRPASAQPAPWATFAFSRSEIVGGGVFLAGRGGRVIGLVPGATEPAWTPDGRRLAYVAPGAAGAGDLFVVDADGSHKGRITATIDDERSPDWSPDGMRLVVARKGNIVVVRADGQGSRRAAAESPTATATTSTPFERAAEGRASSTALLAPRPIRPGRPTAAGSPSSPTSQGSRM